MGAWGPGPTENDGSGDWLAEFVWGYLYEVVESPLQQYLEAEETGGGRREDNATAAAALLVDCTSKKTKSPYGIFNIRYKAKKGGLFDLALEVVDRITADEASVKRWKSPEKRLDALKKLKGELEQARGDAE